MGTVLPDTQTMRTWFGMTARVTIGPSFMHRAGIGRVAIPHPAVANWLLRQGMPGGLQRRLGFTHEFAHFQTAPLVLAYMAALFSLAAIQGGIGLREIFILLTSTQALWEILSEGLMILEAPATYRAYYDGIPLWPRVLFWGVGVFVASAGGLLFIKIAP
jgi:hypothetical protein